MRRTLPFYLPSFIPPGFAITEGKATDEGPGHDVLVILLGKPGAAGEFRSTIQLDASEIAPRRAPIPEAGARVVDINGTPAWLDEHTISGVSVDWHVKGLRLGASGHAPTDAVLDAARRLQIARAGDSGSVGLESLPDGYSVAAQANFVSYRPHEEQQLSFANPARRQLVMGVTRSVGMPLLLAVAGAELVRPTRVRDKEALIAFHTETFGPGAPLPATSIAWRENAEIWISLAGTVEPSALQAMAESVAIVPESAWRSAVDVSAQS